MKRATKQPSATVLRVSAWCRAYGMAHERGDLWMGDLPQDVLDLIIADGEKRQGESLGTLAALTLWLATDARGRLGEPVQVDEEAFGAVVVAFTGRCVLESLRRIGICEVNEPMTMLSPDDTVMARLAPDARVS